jgi:hypothetical protein
MLHETRSSLATDPRDKVFALLGMLTDLERSTYLGLIDYSAPVEHVYQKTIEDILYDTGSLRFLSAVQPHASSHPSSLGELKSWVPDWSRTSDVTPLALGQTFVRPYNAGGRFSDMSGAGYAGLSVRGLTVAEVHLVSKEVAEARPTLHSPYSGGLQSWCDAVQEEVGLHLGYMLYQTDLFSHPSHHKSSSMWSLLHLLARSRARLVLMMITPP